MTPLAGLAIVLGAWGAMFLILGIRHVQLKRPTATHRPASRLGLLLQLAAYGLVFGVRLHPAGLFEGGWLVPVAVAIVAGSALTIAGAVIVLWSQQSLGVQWSLTARLVQGHRLVTTGPYAYVRHPIYAAMILTLLGTGMALTSPPVVAVALASYVGGTIVRVRSEEALMQEAFAAEWAAYRRRVRALIPRVL